MIGLAEKRALSAADKAHRARGLRESGIVDEVARLFFPHHAGDVINDFVARGIVSQNIA